MTSDSMSARPMIIARRMAPAALGLRAMPSHAAAMAWAWPMAPAAAAMPRTNAAETRPQRTPVWLAPESGWYGVSCADAVTAKSARMATNRMSFLFTPISSFREFSDLVFFRRDGATDVHHRQHDEDERLQERAEDAQAHHRPGQHERQHPHEDPGGRVLAEDIAEETHAQREDAREVADHLDGEHERREQRQRPHEVLEVVEETLVLDAAVVVIEERGDGEGEGGVHVARGRLEEEEDAEDVAHEDEHGEGADDVEELVAVVADDVVQQILQAADDHLQELLRAARIVAAQAPRDQGKGDAGDDEHEQGHDDVVGHVDPERVTPDVPVERLEEY